MTDLGSTILCYILAIIKAVFKIRGNYYVIELLRKIYITNSNRPLKKRGYLFIFKTCYATTYTCYEKLPLLMFLSIFYKLVNIWFYRFHPSLHSRYGIGLACQSYTYAPLSTKPVVCRFCSTTKMPTSKVTTKDKNFIFFKGINFARSNIWIICSILTHNLTLFYVYV